MSNTPDLQSRVAAYGDSSNSMQVSCITTDDGRSELLPLSPFNALRYHFGMLLGVDDFETEQAYHRAKMRIHNAWLHRAGVVWGFDVRLDVPHGEIRVLPVPYAETREKCVSVLKLAGAGTYTPPS